jgi:SnoaL-like protein
MLDDKWNAYAKSWSQSNADRDASLTRLVVKDVTYTDPNSEISGRNAFSAHMAQFQKDVPGAYFEIVEVKGHHNKTLARWKLCGQDGKEMMQGTSYAAMTASGLFTSFTGFF